MRAVHFPIGTFTRRSESGIALVITLILLSVTLFMAIAFLAVSRRERGSVLTETDTVTARLAADSGLANAEAQILATVLQTTNPYKFGLLVSTNYVNANGFFTAGPAYANPTNVNYDYYFGGATPLSPADFKQNVANLWYLPRAPVFAYDRTTGTNEFRFYLDLNRNGHYERNGLVLETNSLGFPTGATISETGDPEWIGVLERPDAPHGPNNKFLSRYAFVAMPAGNTLDLNYIHNQSLNTRTTWSPNDDYFRNQGVGSWEINLAAFLADLNTNEWNPPTIENPVANAYQYSQPGSANRGAAFEDAYALLFYRYGGRQMPTIDTLFPYGAAALNMGAVDVFPLGPLMTNTVTPSYIRGGMLFPWAGADNTNHFFALASDVFNSSKAATTNFAFHLQQAGSGVSTYDRYTFYRLLAQLGTDSAPESGKLNVNYVNVDSQGNIVPNMETNLFAWQPAQFFTNAADRLLRAYTLQWFQAGPSNYLATYYNIHTNYFYDDAYGTHFNDPSGLGMTNIPLPFMTNTIPAFGVANIPVLVNNQFVYGPAVQRVLQLAANIYDATTNNTFALGKDFPSVFRPLFTRNSFGNVFITGYANVATVVNSSDLAFSPPRDAIQLAVPTATSIPINVYGVPWVIGAKKGFPNFNEISMNNVVTVTRKLEVTRKSLVPKSPIVATNAAYILSISNSVGVEFWNSYTNAYTNAFQVVVYDNVSMNLTNDRGYSIQKYQLLVPINNNFVYTFWPGSTWINGGGLSPNARSPFIVPINYNIPFITNEVVQWSGNYGLGTTLWQGRADLTLPHFGLLTTNRLQAFILASDAGGRQHVIDYVHFNGPDSQRDLTAEIQTAQRRASYDNMWDTNATSSARGGAVPWGVMSQMGVSQNNPGLISTYWGKTQDDLNRAIAAIDGFTYFVGGTPTMPVPPGYEGVYQSYVTNYTVQVPYTPTVVASYYSSWQANDPLVHSFPGDLVFNDPTGPPRTGTNVLFSSLIVGSTAATATVTNQLLPNIGAVNQRYQPWGKTPQALAGIDQNGYNMAYKDPLVRQSDDWAFPTTKLPTVGWLGRIHRGTPWQTVFLKATNILGLASAVANGTNTWMFWTGNANINDAVNTTPVQDRLMFDVFTTALNDNASRGQLPINVGAGDNGNLAAGLAAWSAVFSGVVVLTNTTVNPNAFNLPSIAPWTISPAGVEGLNSPLGRLVQGIYHTRTNAFFFPHQVFTHVGDILAVPQLSEQSPYLNWNSLVQQQNGISDAMYEWLPQQVMSLLRLSDQPRFVIYSYGQTLTPAPNGVVTGGAQAGMVTNYQVTAETVTRSVIRVEGAPTNTHAVVESYNILPPD